ncbi:MAG: ATP-binding protein [Acidobacteriota bacterium]|nr:ATP-binding protein [Acidobacteriota bacterium]
MTAETVYQVLDSTLDTVDRAEDLAVVIAQRAGFDDISLNQIGLAVHETVANAVIHGNRYSASRKVYVSISVTRDEIKIIVGDEGDGFDPRTIPELGSPQQLLRGAGRGVHLSQALMDEYRVEARGRRGAQITLIKYRK